MTASQEQHTETALSDTSADTVGKFPIQQGFVEGERPALIMAGDGQLTVKALRADPDSHAADLIAAAEGVIPEQDIPVQIPVIIVGSPAVMGLSVGEGSADLHEEGRAVLFDKSVLPFLGG